MLLISPGEIAEKPEAVAARIRGAERTGTKWIFSINEAAKVIRAGHPKAAQVVYRALIETFWLNPSVAVVDQVTRAFNALALIAGDAPTLASGHWKWSDRILAKAMSENPALFRNVIRSRHYAGYRPHGWIEDGNDYPVAPIPRTASAASDLLSADIRLVCSEKTAPRLRRVGINTMDDLLALNEAALMRLKFPGDAEARLDDIRAQVKALRAEVGKRYPTKVVDWLDPDHFLWLIEQAYDKTIPQGWRENEAEYEILLAGERYMTTICYRWDIPRSASGRCSFVCTRIGDLFDDPGDRIYRQRQAIGAGWFNNLDEADAALGPQFAVIRDLDLPSAFRIVTGRFPDVLHEWKKFRKSDF